MMVSLLSLARSPKTADAAYALLQLGGDEEEAVSPPIPKNLPQPRTPSKPSTLPNHSTPPRPSSPSVSVTPAPSATPSKWLITPHSQTTPISATPATPQSWTVTPLPSHECDEFQVRHHCVVLS